MTSAVAVSGWSAFVPGFASLADWLASRPSAEHDAPKGVLVPVRDRRRASPLSRALADAYAGAVERAGVDPKQIASVFGSALGEVSTMIGLLDQMWSDGTPLSPMKFATSVHNAASGMISIATGNRGFTTSLGADYDTPAMALLEGIALVQSTGLDVVVCCGDETPPENLVPANTAWSLLSVAVVLSPLEQAKAGAFRLSDFGLAPEVDAPPDALAPPTMSIGLARNPNVGLLDLAIALERALECALERPLEVGLESRVRLDRGRGRGYSVCIKTTRST